MITKAPELSNLQKARIAELLAATEKCLQDGADEHLQLLSLMAQVMKELSIRTNNSSTSSQN